MSYPQNWMCPVCKATNQNTNICKTCGYIPVLESGPLEPVKKKENFLKKRIIAFLIDFAFIVSIALIYGFGVALTFPGQDLKTAFIIFSLPLVFLFIVFHPVYFILFEGFYSTTIGKKLMSIQVKSSGADINFTKSFLRNITRFIEMIPLYIPSIIMIKKTGKRLGDKFANTYISKE